MEDQMEMDDNEGGQRAAKLTSKNKLPKTPDFSELMVSPKRASPFILDDFRGSNAYRKTNP